VHACTKMCGYMCMHVQRCGSMYKDVRCTILRLLCLQQKEDRLKHSLSSVQGVKKDGTTCTYVQVNAFAVLKLSSSSSISSIFSGFKYAPTFGLVATLAEIITESPFLLRRPLTAVIAKQCSWQTVAAPVHLTKPLRAQALRCAWLLPLPRPTSAAASLSTAAGQQHLHRGSPPR
jgi:hypothetical protein